MTTKSSSKTVDRTDESAVPQNPLLALRHGSLSLEYKVGNLFFQYVSNTGLSDRLDTSIRGEDVADLLERDGYITTRFRVRGGLQERVYHWNKEPPTKTQFLNDILGLRTR